MYSAKGSRTWMLATTTELGFTYSVCEDTQDPFVQVHDGVVGTFVPVHHLSNGKLPLKFRLFPLDNGIEQLSRAAVESSCSTNEQSETDQTETDLPDLCANQR